MSSGLNIQERLMAPTPRRIAAQPDPAAYGDGDLLTLAEAAALLFPQGPLTTSSLRSAYRKGTLEVIVISRKVMVTKRAIAAMTEAARRPVRPPEGS